MHNNTITNNDNQIIATSVGTLITTWVTKKYSFDMTQYGMLLTIINLCVSKIMKINGINMSNIYNILSCSNIYKCVFGLIGLGILFLFCKKFKQFNFIGSKYCVLNVYNKHDISKFIKYTHKYNSFYEKNNEYDIGNPLNEINKQNKVSDNIKVKFNDTNCNIKGYYMFKTLNPKQHNSEKHNSKNEIQESSLHLIICINKLTKFDISTYIEFISNLLEVNKTKIGEKIKLYHSKIIPSFKEETGKKIHYMLDTIIYNGPSLSINDLEKQYIDTYFHPEKQNLWNQIKTIHTNPEHFYKIGQSAQIGLLLYGPPGCGKSTFAYRIASTLQRHIVSLDLSYRSKYSGLDDIINPVINDVKMSHKDVVFILDEFDLTIKALYEKEKRQQALQEMYIKTINKSSIFINENESETENESEIKSKNKNKNNTTLEFKKIDNEIYEQKTQISLSDLLELFQGSVPLNGAIIIATTNKFEEINEICPRLFRAGRLTPVKFDYPTGKIVNEMSYFYYKKKIHVSDNYKFKICMAQIIDYIKDANNEFSYFEKKIMQHIQTNN